jgi:hypothetical protein
MRSFSAASLLIPVIFLQLIPAAAALGINCRGSSICTQGSFVVADNLTTYISSIDQGRWYKNGEHIACEISVFETEAIGDTPATTDIYCFCAFLQNTRGAWGSDILRLAHYIPDHGCNTCGSVPYFYPSDNNVRHGELTYNYASSCGGSGLS